MQEIVNTNKVLVSNLQQTLREEELHLLNKISVLLTGNEVEVHRLVNDFDTFTKLFCIAHGRFQETGKEQVGIFDKTFFVINKNGEAVGPLSNLCQEHSFGHESWLTASILTCARLPWANREDVKA